MAGLPEIEVALLPPGTLHQRHRQVAHPLPQHEARQPAQGCGEQPQQRHLEQDRQGLH